MTPREARWRERVEADYARLRPRTTAEAHRKLWRLARELKRHGFESGAAVLLAYLSGHAGSLDEAFGLQAPAKAGRPRDAAVDTLTRRISAMRRARRSWAQIADELGGDERELRRAYALRRPQLMAAEIDRRLTAKPPKRKGGG